MDSLPRNPPNQVISSHWAHSDCIGRPTTSALQWDPLKIPFLFAAQYIDDDMEKAVTHVKSTLRTALTVLILLYLDTRKTVDDPIPAWMSIYSIMYDETRVVIVSNYPTFRKVRPADREPRWWLQSFHSVAFRRPFNDRHNGKGYLLSTLLRIQSHGRHLLKRLQEWQGYERVLAPLFDSDDNPN
jgi:hypothetical protein